MKLKSWIVHIETENAVTKAALTVAGMTACKVFVDYVKSYRDGKRVMKFYSKYPEPFKGII